MKISQNSYRLTITEQSLSQKNRLKPLDRYCYNFLKFYPRQQSRQQRIQQQLHSQQRALSYESDKQVRKGDYNFQKKENTKDEQITNFYSEWMEFCDYPNQKQNINLSKIIRVVKAPQLKMKNKLNYSFKTEKQSEEKKQSSCHSAELKKQTRTPQYKPFIAKPQCSIENFPKLTARSYVVYNNSEKKIIQSHKPNISIQWNMSKIILQGRQVASLTKIITCLTTLELISKHQIQTEFTFLQVHKDSTKIKGTTAHLKINHLLTLKDLLYGMMLPSGNDAAQTIADGLGYFLYQIKKEIIKQDSKGPLILDKPGYSSLFIQKMNNWKFKIPLLNSNFDCAHGLANKLNTSSAMDITLASSYAMKYKLFNEIIQTVEYKTQQYQNNHQYYWKNTNKLLQKGYSGIKTGNTDPAGPCLASSIKIKESNYIIVVLNCRSPQERFEEIEKIVSWLNMTQNNDL